MPIVPLAQFEADLEADRRAYAALKAPKSIVVRFGVMKLVGEFPYDGDAKPGCGSKLVVRTHRGTEIGEMLTSTCPNSGCSKSVTRKQMLEYIDNSGGRDYPFFTDGRILRVATPADMEAQNRIEQDRNAMRLEARRVAEQLQLPVKVVEAEPLLGGERITFYFTSEERVDFREMVRMLSQHFGTRIELRQVGARDEARLTADYERCGQYCCCKNFLKVLKPISMRSAKVQKATLDPLKISGRCGRLMCCLRYEDQTYEELRKRLPRRKQRVGTPEGDGWVVDTQILTQLALIQLEASDKQVAVPVEELTEPSGPPVAVPQVEVMPRNGRSGQRPEGRPDRRPERQERPERARFDAPPQRPTDESPSEQEAAELVDDADEELPSTPEERAAPEGQPPQESQRKRRRRRRRRRGKGGGGTPGGTDPGTGQ